MAMANRFVLEDLRTKTRKKKNFIQCEGFQGISQHGKREIEAINCVEVQEIIKKFVLPVQKKNGEEYEPLSIKAAIFEKNNYGFSVLNNKEFHEVQDILKKKQKQLKPTDKGNWPNAEDPLSDEDIATFYSHRILGIHSP